MPASRFVLPLLALLGACRATPPAPQSPPAPPVAAAEAMAITAPPQDWQAYLGRRVRIAVPLVFNGQRGDTLVASFDGRLYAPTEVARPGAEAVRVAVDNARRRVWIEGAAAQAMAAGWRSGSTIVQVQGRVVQRPRGGFALRADAPLQVAAAVRPAVPSVAGDLRVASFNLENLFNGDGRGGGFPTPRGARSADEYARQLGKLVATIRALQPDIAALMELENDGYGPDSSIAALVAALNEAKGGDWRSVVTGAGTHDSGPGGNPIRVGLVYRASRVTPVGRPALLHGGPFDLHSRVPLAQAFRAGKGPRFVIVATHLKSKGCAEAGGAERDQKDGQACWNAVRTDSARRLDAWLNTDPTRSRGDLVAIVGDFNAYAMEDPVQALLAQGWQDAMRVARVQAPYSYVYDAQAGRLDHALLSPALAKRLAGAAEWHGNADEPENVGYREAIGGDPAATPWRSSDHDPFLLGFRLHTR